MNNITEKYERMKCCNIIEHNDKEQLLSGMKKLMSLANMHDRNDENKNNIYLAIDIVVKETIQILEYNKVTSCKNKLFYFNEFDIDSFTEEHSINVMLFSIVIGINMNLDNITLQELAIAAILHDIGKAFTPDFILNKKSRFNNDDYSIIKIHPLIGKLFINNYYDKTMINDDILHGIAEHHERIDGSGYYKGLNGNQIGLLARIISIADVFEAILAARPYKTAQSIDKALLIISEPDKYDITIVNTLKEIIYNHKLIIGNRS